MRSVFFLAIIISSSCLLKAQDILYKVDGSQQVVKIIEIKENSIKYQTGQNDFTYVISKEKVNKVVFENGKVEEFNKLINIDMYNADLKNEFGKNFLYINTLDLLSGLLTIGYEHTLKSQNFSVRVPLSLGLSKLGSKSNEYNYSEGYYNRYKNFSTGVDFNFYPMGQGKAKYFLGPSFEYGTAFNQNWQGRETYYALLFQNGFLFQPTKHFNISLNLGLGYTQSRFKGDYSYDEGYLTLRGGLNIGYKF